MLDEFKNIWQLFRCLFSRLVRDLNFDWNSWNDTPNLFELAQRTIDHALANQRLGSDGFFH